VEADGEARSIRVGTFLGIVALYLEGKTALDDE
jgi:hypothetical protein